MPEHDGKYPAAENFECISWKKIAHDKKTAKLIGVQYMYK